jgi:hypothetical protein
LRASFIFQVFSNFAGSAGPELRAGIALTNEGLVRDRAQSRVAEKLSLQGFGCDLSRLAIKTRFSPAELQQKLA